MKKILSCLLATTLVCSVVTTASCSFLGGVGDKTSAVSSIDESKVSLSLRKKTYKIEDGQSVALEVEFTLDGEAMDLSLLGFESTDVNVATVSEDGIVTGVNGGKAYITISYGEKSVRATVNVVKRENVLTVSDERLTLLEGTDKQITPTVRYGLTEIANPLLVWSTSDPAVAQVENGLITAISSGKAEITVTYENVSKQVAVLVGTETTAENVNTFSEEYVNIYGRSYIQSGKHYLDHAANGVEVGVIGTSLTVTISSIGKSYMRVFVDGNAGVRKTLQAGTHDYVVADDLSEGCHVIRIVKGTEECSARWQVDSFFADGFFVAPEKSDLKIQFIGDSITAGYGVFGSRNQEYSVDNSDATKTYAYLAAQELDADYSILAYSGICTKAYHWAKNINMVTLYQQFSFNKRNRYNTDFDADVVVLNLGTNEDSYLSTPEGSGYGAKFPSDYQEFLQTLRMDYPNAYIICLYGMASESSAIQQGIQGAIAMMQDDKIVYNPFEFVGNGEGANGHPTVTAHETWGEALAAYIKTLDF
jgi:hypothetical protein